MEERKPTTMRSLELEVDCGHVPQPLQLKNCVSEAKTLFMLAFPIMVTMISQSGMMITDQVMVGHLVGTTESLAAAGIANAIYSITWYFTLGACSALDTLGSQSYGAGDILSLPKWGYICSCTLTILNIFSALILFFGGSISEHIYLQDPSLSAMVSTYCRLLIPGLFPLTLSLIFNKLLQVQGRTTSPMIIAIVTFFVNIFMNEVLIRKYGFSGAPLATSASRYSMLIMTIIYIFKCPIIPASHSAQTSSKRVVYTLSNSWKLRRTFLELALHGSLMMGMECTSFEITTAFAAQLGEVEIAAHTALMNIIAFTFLSFPFGISVASTIRMGNLLGAQQPNQAKVAGYTAVCAGTTFMLICGIIMLACRNIIGQFFSNQKEIINAIGRIVPIAALFQIFDGLMGTTAGSLRGMGRQRQVLVFNVLGLWIIGVTSGYILTFSADQGLQGLWWGISMGVFTTAVLSLVALYRVNWPYEAYLAAVRTDTAEVASNSDA